MDTKISQQNFSITSLSQTSTAITLFENDFTHYFSPGQKNPFAKTNDKKKLPPPDLGALLPDTPAPFCVPPLPAPGAGYWSLFPRQQGTAGTDKTDPALIQLFLAAWNKPMAKAPVGAYAKKLLTLVHADDIVRTQNGKEWRGKIIKETPTEIILGVQGPIKSFSISREQIAQIEPKLSLEQAIMAEAQQLATEPAAMLKLAQACMELEMPQLAKDVYRQLLVKFPQQPDSYVACANFYLAQPDLDQAYRVYLQAQTQGINAEEMRLVGAKVEAALGLTEKAMATLGSCYQLPALLLQAQLAFQLGRISQVTAIADQILALKPGNLGQNKVCYWQARIAFTEGRLDDCLLRCDEASAPLSPEIANLKGAALYLQGKWSDADKLLQGAAQTGMPEAWYNLALLAWAQGARELALEILKNLQTHIAQFPEPSALLATFAYLQYLDSPMQNYSAAMELLTQARTFHGDHQFYVAYVAGEIEEGRGNAGWKEAYAYYQKALTLKFSFSYVLTKLSVLAVRQNLLADAIHYFQELSSRKVGFSASAIWEREALAAYLDMLAGNRDDAYRRAELVAASVAGHPMALKILIRLANEQGKSEEALALAQKLLAVAPRDAFALQAYEKISSAANQVVWEESFSRQDSEFVRRRWVENEAKGIGIALRHNQVVFAGQELEGGVPTTLTRLIEEKNFIAMAGKLEVSATAPAYVGIFVAGFSQGTALYLARNPENCLVYALHKPGTKISWEKIIQDGKPLTWPDGTVSLSIQRDTKKGNSYTLWLNNALLPGTITWNTKEYARLMVGFFGMAPAGTVWELQADGAMIVEKP